MEGVATFKCGHPKVEENSRPRSRGEKGVQCRTCRIAQNVRWNKAHPENLKANKERQRQRRIEPLMKEQKGLCGICEQPLVFPKTRPYLDHDHSCCPVGTKGCEKCRRGLLCPDCNTKLAAVEKPGFIRKAKTYLAKWRRD